MVLLDTGFEKIRTVGKGAYGTAVLYRKKDDDSLVILKEINLHDMNAAERQVGFTISVLLFISYAICTLQKILNGACRLVCPLARLCNVIYCTRFEQSVNKLRQGKRLLSSFIFHYKVYTKDAYSLRVKAIVPIQQKPHVQCPPTQFSGPIS